MWLLRMEHVRIYLFLIIFANLQLLSNCVSLEKELTLTSKEKLALDKFRDLVTANLTHEHMKKDIYLIKWLRARNLDVPEAQRMLMNNLKWRKEYRMDDIMNEDFSYYEEKYPFWLDGRDMWNRPVGTADISVWDPRPAILSGNGEKLLRFAIRVLETATTMVREDQAKGLNVTQFTLIGNLAGFNLIQHGCLRCIPIYIQFLITYENYFPGMLNKLYFVNTPAAFDVLLQIALPVLHPETREALAIFGTNKNQWIPEILDFIPSEQIRPQFGGSKKLDPDLDNYYYK